MRRQRPAVSFAVWNAVFTAAVTVAFTAAGLYWWAAVALTVGVLAATFVEID